MRIAVAGGTGVVGRHVVDIARERGNEVVILSRFTGVDLLTRTGLDQRLEGTDAVIDVTSILTQSGPKSRAFFSIVTANLLEAEKAAGVGHHIVLSIVGSDRAPFGYYAGKAAQEQLVTGGEVPWTILRATQFHEFAGQLYLRIKLGPVNIVPTMTSQPVAAREVAERLVELAEATPSGRATDIAGPEVLRMADMVTRYKKAIGAPGPVLEAPLPGGFGTAMRDGTLLPGPSAELGSQTFADWVAGVEQEHRGTGR
ncbi:SDR family oxidoreductase [Mycetocola manganoxydans]|uniref:SDR family oxidoreductase n=1 Tax=Mycetocola manganoxydans TaxID=699879 RepID=A0A3L6ZM89_9MICO|nr:SDR family oxidoreductase [Mycetocola manganoxydans]RLP69019.1 SDR family oxidoreductase [Mycetocola manganoxydans]GHD52888.1 nucleoside-diphosphate sugar epimerase [Mycetocola manganoxydans]